MRRSTEQQEKVLCWMLSRYVHTRISIKVFEVRWEYIEYTCTNLVFFCTDPKQVGLISTGTRQVTWGQKYFQEMY